MRSDAFLTRTACWVCVVRVVLCVLRVVLCCVVLTGGCGDGGDGGVRWEWVVGGWRGGGGAGR